MPTRIFSRYRSRTYKKTRGRRTPYRRTRRSRLANTIRKIAQTIPETKFIQSGRENLQLYHDVGVGTGPTTNQIAISADPWSLITQGITRSTRIGDKINPIGYRLRLWFANKADRVDLLYRVIIVLLPRTVGTTIPTGANLDLFRAMDSGVNNSTMCGEIDKEIVKRVLLDKTYHLQNSTGYDTKEVHMVKNFYVKYKRARPLEYVNNGGQHKSDILATYVIPYDSYGTLQTDIVASCAYVERLYYKDA